MAVPWTLTWVCGTQVNVNSNCDVLRNCLYISHITSCCVWWVVLLPLQLKILVEEDNFKVAVDDVHLLEYEHRVGGFEEVTLVRIVGDVALYSAAPSMIWESDWLPPTPPSIPAQETSVNITTVSLFSTKTHSNTLMESVGTEVKVHYSDGSWSQISTEEFSTFLLDDVTL